MQVFSIFRFPIHSFRLVSFMLQWIWTYEHECSMCAKQQIEVKLSYILNQMQYQSLFSTLYTPQSQMHSCVFHLTLFYTVNVMETRIHIFLHFFQYTGNKRKIEFKKWIIWTSVDQRMLVSLPFHLTAHHCPLFSIFNLYQFLSLFVLP